MTESAPAAPFFVPGGTLPRDAPCYVERTADRELLAHLQRGDFCYILTARQMGKSSLMVRTAERLRREGVAVAILDLTALGQNLTPEQWYLGQLRRIARHLELEDEAVDYWLELDPAAQSPFLRWQQSLREVIVERCPGPLVLFIDEIDVVRSLPFSTDEFFAGIRECYNRRADDPAMARLTFCLLGVATPSDLIQDVRTTPFNIGHRIDLRDLAERDARGLTPGLVAAGRTPEQAEALLRRVLYWTGGHPFLTQRLCLALAEDPSATDPESVDTWCERLFLSQSARQRDDNLLFVGERLLRGEVDLATLLAVYRRLLTGRRPVRDDGNSPSVDLLRLSGLVTRDENGYLSVRNRIYRRVFDTAWVDEHMPDAELKRQRRIYRNNLIRVMSLSGALVALFAGISIYALGERNRAERARESEEDSAFLLSTSNASSAYTKGNIRLFSDVVNVYSHHPRYRTRAEVGVLRYLAGRNPAMIDNTQGQSFFDVLALSADRRRKKVTVLFGDGQLQTFNLGSRSHTGDRRLVTEAIQTAAINADGSQVAIVPARQNINTPGRVVLYRQRDDWHGVDLPLWDVSMLRFLDDGRLVAVQRANSRQEVVLIDPARPTVRRTLLVPTGTTRIATDGARYVLCVVSAPTVSTELTKPERASRIHLVDLTTGAHREIDVSLYGTTVVDLKMIPGTHQLVAAFRDRRLRFWDAATGAPSLPSVPMSSPIVSLGVTEDGGQIFTGHLDHTIQSWRIDPATRELQFVARYAGHKDPVHFVTAASPHLLSVSRSEVFQWTIIGQGKPAPERDNAALFLGPTFYAADIPSPTQNPVVRTYTIEHYAYGSARPSWRSDPIAFGTFTAHAPDGSRLAVADGNRVRLLAFGPDGRQTGGIIVLPPSGDQGRSLLSVSFSPDSQTLTLLYASGRVIRRDVKSGRQESWRIDPRHSLESYTNTFSYSFDGRWLCVLCSNCDLLLIDLSNQSAEYLTTKANLINDLAVSPDGRRVALALMNNPSDVFKPSGKRHTDTGPLQVIDVKTKQVDSSPIAQVNSQSRVRFSEDGKTIIVIIDSYRIVMLDSGKLRETLNLDSFEMGLKYKRMSTDSKHILAMDESDRLVEVPLLP